MKVVNLTVIALMLGIGIIKAQTINYTVIEDNPKKPVTQFGISLLNIDFSLKETEGFVGLTFYGKHQLNEKLRIGGLLEIPYLDMAKGGNEEGYTNESGYKYRSKKILDVHGALTLNSKTKTSKKPTKFFVEQDKYIPLSMETKKETMLRGGVISYNKSMITYIADENNLAIEDNVGVNFRTTALYGGFELQISQYKSIDATEYGKVSSGNVFEYYCDVFFLTINTFKKISVNGTEYTGKDFNNTFDNLNYSNFGYRFGFAYHKTSPTWFNQKMTYYAEVGKRPIDGTYIKCGVIFPMFNIGWM